MGFSDRRIPATRMGSGGDNRSIARLRRHVTKGFSDDLPGPGSTIVNAAAFPDGKQKWFNLWQLDLALSLTQGLSDPDFVGQILVLSLNDSTGGTATWTLNMAKITDGLTDYTEIAFNADGENAMLIGMARLGVKRWYVVSNHGGVLA